MSLLASLRREGLLLRRERALMTWMLVTVLLSAAAVAAGLGEVADQRATLARLLAADRADRESVLAARTDWGDAAYNSLHLAWDPPSAFAFAALGLRDQLPWKHRIRMLALEGQIHEADALNPEFALAGRFDFAFLAAFVLPLVLIALLHDLRAAERGAGRLELLEATAGRARALWLLRAGLRGAAIFACAIVPLLAGALISGTAANTLVAALAVLLAHVAFWTLLAGLLSAWRQSAPVMLAALLGVWALLGIIVPAGGRLAIDRLVPLPSGADIMLTQREAVNDAWDLPKAATMTAFLERHPQWAAMAQVEKPFEWKWYFAFQQVGDQQAEALSGAYRAGRLARDRLAGRLALLAPPALTARALQRLAGTDLPAALAYEASVRDFHARLRAWYYPKLFKAQPFEASALANLPEYQPRSLP